MQKLYLPVGSKYGRWTVISSDAGTNAAGVSLVIAECTCGTIRTVKATLLHRGGSKSCGCLFLDKRTIASRQNLRNAIVKNAKIIKERFAKKRSVAVEADYDYEP